MFIWLLVFFAVFVASASAKNYLYKLVVSLFFFFSFFLWCVCLLVYSLLVAETRASASGHLFKLVVHLLGGSKCFLNSPNMNCYPMKIKEEIVISNDSI